MEMIDLSIDKKVLSVVAKKYNPLDYSDSLIKLLESIYPNQDFEKNTKHELHKLLNATLLGHYKGEEVFKYKLFERFLSQRNIVAAFEIKVNNSRADFLTINGSTTSFEIKTRLDNFSKFSKQAGDYLKAFEFNYLVVDESHMERANDIVPEQFGLWVYKKGKHKQLKKASLSTQIDPTIQLRLLSKRELLSGFPETDGLFKEILKCFDSNEINLRFKKLLKSRYKERWSFLVSNQAEILPIDLQFFFNRNILPGHIYYY